MGRFPKSVFQYSPWGAAFIHFTRQVGRGTPEALELIRNHQNQLILSD